MYIYTVYTLVNTSTLNYTRMCSWVYVYAQRCVCIHADVCSAADNTAGDLNTFQLNLTLLFVLKAYSRGAESSNMDVLHPETKERGEASIDEPTSKFQLSGVYCNPKGPKYPNMENIWLLC